MNDLLDRRLKKMNHDVKYNKVAFEEKDIQKIVQKAKQRPHRFRKSWMVRTLPIPAAAVLLFLCFQVMQSPSDQMHTASFLPEKQLADKEKMTQTFDQSNIHQLKGEQSLQGAQAGDQTSTMVRQTYVIHEGARYVQTGQLVDSSRLDEVIGTVQDSTAQTAPSMNHAPMLFPKAKIYSVKGKKDSEAIAIQSRHNSGVGSSSVSQQGYFLFEKEAELKKAQ
ncbi:hypothetical protein MUN89_00085 [Halobacillus salinarum]|uniref:LPS export ABC transporter periplasmic protein LptC n=1 Tax=Halobacillus salinarum TaxID=2932257 RepID=A0ABY4EKC8_9BACI|nr:hypothetical protein [Halobacillus salinarum]UOQ44435.1 hypothetical protein MUN89_00085 [Halobacillus salinarum]